MTQDFVYQLVRLEAKTLSGQIEKAIATFQVYINPAVGWHLASFFARTRMMFPITVIGRDHWLFKAYMMQLNPNLCHDSYVESAFEIFHNPGMAAKLKALLITGLDDPIDAHLTIVAEKTGIPRHTVEAFEILFTNVLDRPKDGLNISSILYRSEKYFGEGQTPPGGGRKQRTHGSDSGNEENFEVQGRHGIGGKGEMRNPGCHAARMLILLAITSARKREEKRQFA